MKPTVWRDAVRDSELDWVAKAALMTLSTFMNGRAEAFPAKDTLAAGSGLSKRAVDRAIIRGEKAGYLVVSRTRGRSANRYFGVVPNPVPGTGLTVHEVQGSDESNPVPDGLQPCPNPVRGTPESGKAFKAKERAREAQRAAAAPKKGSAAAPAFEDNGQACNVCEQPLPVAEGEGQWWCEKHYADYHRAETFDEREGGGEVVAPPTWAELRSLPVEVGE